MFGYCDKLQCASLPIITVVFNVYLDGNSPVAVTTASTFFILASSPPPLGLASYTVAPSLVSSWCQSPMEEASSPAEDFLSWSREKLTTGRLNRIER